MLSFGWNLQISYYHQKAWALINVFSEDQGACYALIDINCQLLEPNHSNHGFYFGPFNKSANPLDFTACARDGQTCDTPGKSTVAYGLDNRYVYKNNVTGPISCSLTTFGADPYVGQHKACFIQPSGPDGYTFCTRWYESCNVQADATAAYGLDGQWTYHRFSAPFTCSPPQFGLTRDTDPTGYRSSCFTAGPGGGAEFCGREGQTCYVTSKSTVSYGADGHFARKYGVTGSIGCGAGHFGDPISGVVKSCFAKKE